MVRRSNFQSLILHIFNLLICIYILKEVDRMISQGENVLNDIRDQKSMLSTIRRKMMNVTNSLGLSNTLIKMIERRNTSDKFILYGGMVFTLFIMFLAVKYLI